MNPTALVKTEAARRPTVTDVLMTARNSIVQRATIFALVLSLVLPFSAWAKEPTTSPLIRVETGMHTTLIRRVLPDIPRNRLITCSDDKTIRVWQMPEMRLLSVLRVPIDDSHEGQLYAIAVSPDGKTVAAGGWTGWDWDGKASIYFFDVASGELIRRIGGFDDVVNALLWLPDGQHLAVGLQNLAGFRMLRLSDGQVVAADTQYKDDVMDMDISSQGRIVVTALDGYVRLYDRNFKLIGRRMVPGGLKPISVRFSPDAATVAVGFIDKPAIAVISARDMALQYHPDTINARDQVGFTSVVWSSDGTMLYASGQYAGNGLNPVYRWPDKGKGAMKIIPLTQNRITEIQQMPDNQIAFAAEDPGLGVLGADDKLKLFRGPDIANFSNAQAQLALSADAAVVAYPLRRDSQEQHSFSVLAGGDQETANLPQEAVFPPILDAAGIKVADWKDGFKPTINGKSPVLEDYEMSRSYAISPDSKNVLFGTEWAVRLLRLDASEVWSVKLPAVAWSVNVSRNGLLAAAALSDGSIRWYRMQDGQEVLAYFPHNNGRDWIAWVPDGYYTSSIYGDNFVGWHVNRGKDLAPDFYRAVQFDRILYRPDVVTNAFRIASAGSTRSLESPVLNADFQISRLREIAPPRLKLTVDRVDLSSAGKPKVALKVEGEKNVLALKDYSVFVNGIPVTPSRQRVLAGLESAQFTRSLQLDLTARANDIRVEAFNGVSMGVAETYVGLQGDVTPAHVNGDLYMLTIGANVFPNLPKRMHLAYAAQDAEEVGKTLQLQGIGNYEHIYMHTLSDSTEKPDHDAVMAALSFAEQAGPNDTVVIFLASHGISDVSGNYYFVPRDVQLPDIARAQKGETASSLVPWTAFFDALRSSAGRRVLIVDTCHARDIEGSFEAHSLQKRSASSQFALIVAAKGNEESQEYAPAKHGLFTYSLLSAMNKESDKNRDGIVSLQEMFDAAVPVVESLRYKQAGPQTPQMVAPQVLSNMPLLKTQLTSP